MSKRSMRAGDGGDILALIDVLARLRQLQSFPWTCLASIQGRRELAAVATLVGAGLMGAIVFIRSFVTSSSSSSRSRSIRSLAADQSDLTVAGLQNWGNNCFLNAILQALASSQKFATYLKAYELQQPGVDQSELHLPSMPLSAALCDLLQELAEVAPGRRIVSPRHVMRVLGHYARSFDLAMQQDAAEALSYLATAVQQERMEEFEESKPALQSLADVSKDESDAPPHDIALQCWRQQLRWPMEGTYGSLLACSQCGFQAAMQFQFFRDVSLPLPCTPDGYIRIGCTIEDCLIQFTMLERVSNFRCNRCAHLAAVCYLNSISENNKDVLKVVQNCNYDDNCSCESLLKERAGLWFRIQSDAYKCLQIGRCPEVLCLHLQRVMVNPAGHLEKLMGHVSFSTELDMYPFTIASQQGVESKQATRTGLSRHPTDLFETKFSPRAVLKALEASNIMTIYSRTRCVGGAGCAGNMEQDSASSDVVSGHDDVQMREQEVSTPGKQAGHEDVEMVDGEADTGKNSERVNRQQLYDLISVVVHHGSPMSGHYTVYRKVNVPRDVVKPVQEADQQRSDEETIWFEISDTQVVKVLEEEVLAARASLLFYELR